MARMISCSRCRRPCRTSPCCGQGAYASLEYQINSAKMLAAWIPGSPCVICGIKIWQRHEVSIEHLVKVRDGGSNDPLNLAYAHRRCNSAERSKPALLRYRRPPRI